MATRLPAATPTTDDYTDWMQAAADAEQGRSGHLGLVLAVALLLAIAAVLL